MIRRLMLLLLIIFLLSEISALCNETQIDINTANLTELDRLDGVGLVIAQNIINYRQNNSFNSIDELVNVNGIAEKKLANIKTQGLACVNENEEKIIKNETQISERSNEDPEENSEILEEETDDMDAAVLGSSDSASPTTTANSTKATTKTITLETINLDSKNIKSEDNNQGLKKNLALTGIVTFCVGFGALFLLRTAKRKKENEFR
jgi:competence ComEA-like helix-hairpin-helix protein